jgi:pyruvate dehydrogenase E2 component (dihydrolipoamide acetyltransferase)
VAEIIIMPKLGFNMDEGQLVKWHKVVGDPVTKGEVLFEINTDKTTMSVEATSDGTLLAILLKEGAFADVFTPIAVVGAPGEDYSAPLAEAQKKSETAASGSAVAADSALGVSTAASIKDACIKDASIKDASIKELRLTPKAKKLLKDEGIDPSSLIGIQGTGYQCGITAKDIKASPLARKLAAATGVDLAAVTGTGIGDKIMKGDVAAAQLAESATPPDGRKILSVAPYKGIRKIIGDKLSQSKFTAPHLYFTESVDTTAFTAMQKQLNEIAEVKIAVSDLLTMAAAKALKKHPGVNASLIDEKIVQYKSVNVGTAVAGNNGLIVPVVKDVQEKSLTDVARESKDLIARAKEGRLEPHEYSGGTFTISNLGMFGIENFTAIINGTESAILSVSSVRKKAVAVAGETGEDVIGIRPMMNIQLSVDHRLIDGLLAAQFIGAVKRLLENPIEMLI